MSIFEEINFFAVFFSGIIGFLWGMVWYSNLMFGRYLSKQQSRYKVEDDKRRFPIIYNLVTSILSAFSMELIRIAFISYSFLYGLLIGLLIGFGIIFINMLPDFIFLKIPKNIFWIISGYRITFFIIVGILLSIL